MDNFSSMPPLVDRSPGRNDSNSAGYPNGFVRQGSPRAFLPHAPASPPRDAWGEASTDAGWTAQTQGTPQWPPQTTLGAWPAPNMLMSPGFPQPAIANPAMPGMVDGWPLMQPGGGEDFRNASGFFGKPDEEGWVSVRSASRPLTPFSSSTSSPASSGSAISRSRSVHSVRVHGEKAKRPPREWRPDFSRSKSLGLGAIGSMFTKARSASISGSILDLPKTPKLHPYLRHSITSPPMRLDLRRNPSTLRFTAIPDREINPWDLTRFACEPPMTIMKLYNPHYPWYIDVESANPTGVTLHELFAAIWVSMMTPISHEDYWNNEMDEYTREGIANAWSARCGDDEERNKGVRRVDFLMDRVKLEGIVKGKEGMWELKIKKL